MRSGDGECFAWEVTPEAFFQVTGRKPDPYDFAALEKEEYEKGVERFYADGEEGDYIEYITNPSICLLYPNDIFGYEKKNSKITVIIEDVE